MPTRKRFKIKQYKAIQKITLKINNVLRMEVQKIDPLPDKNLFKKIV